MSKAFELAEIVRHFTYDADNGKFDTSKKRENCFLSSSVNLRIKS